MTATLFDTLGSNLVFALWCVVFNAFFVTTEFALVKVRSSRIQELAEGGNRRAQTVLKMLEDIEGYLAATQLGITLMSLGLGWVGEASLSHAIESYFPS